MKLFKHIAAVLILFLITSTQAKQIGKKAATTTSVTTPTATIPQPTPKKQPQLRQGTYRELLAELRNMKTNDVFTPDKSQFTDKIVQLFARIEISGLSGIERGTLRNALATLHMIETIVPINIEMESVELQKKVELHAQSLIEDLDNRVNNVVQEYESQTREKSKTTMQSSLEMQTMLRLNRFINKSDLNNNDMKEICAEIDSLLRKAHQDYIQLGSTNAEQIANANMAIDITKNEIINKLSELSPKTMLKLADYILLTQQNDKVMMEIGKELNMRAIAGSL
jgi:hypothetical protein